MRSGSAPVPGPAARRLDGPGGRALLRLALIAYLPQAVLFGAAIVPGVNSLYSGHGGVGWLLGLLAFPATALLLLKAALSAVGLERRAHWRLLALSFAIFQVCAVLASIAGAAALRSSFGLTLRPLDLWILLATPFGFLLLA